MNTTSPRRDYVIVATTIATGAVGMVVLVVGFILQINLYGHGPVTAQQRLGVLVMFAGPLFAAAAGVASAITVRRPGLRALCGLQAFVALAVTGLLAFGVFSSNAREQRNLSFLKRQRIETQRFQQHFEAANRAFHDGRREARVIGRYEATAGTLVDGYVLGPPEEVNEDDFAVSSGRIERFTWVHPVDGREPMRIEWTPPPPAPVQALGDDPRYQDLLHPPLPQPQPVRRFVFHLVGADGNVALRTPYGEIPLPPVSEQPLQLVLRGSRFEDLITERNREALP